MLNFWPLLGYGLVTIKNLWFIDVKNNVLHPLKTAMTAKNKLKICMKMSKQNVIVKLKIQVLFL